MSNGQEMTFDWDRGMFVPLDREAIRQSDHVIRNNQQNADTLHRIQQNDASLQVLQVGCDIEINETPIGDGKFTVPCITGDSSEYSTLGEAVATNEHIKKLKVHVLGHPLDIEESGFFDGLKLNTSINNLELHCAEGVGLASVSKFGRLAHEILKKYQENNNLTQLVIHNAATRSDESSDILCHALRTCTNLTSVTLDNRIGNNNYNIDPREIASILEDPNCNIHYLSLENNDIDIGCATIIANSLASNTKLVHLNLQNNGLEEGIEDVFSRLLCNASTINDTYSSNHTLEKLVYRRLRSHGTLLVSLLKLNRITNKGHVAIKKILRYHPNIDMEQLFEWGSDGERSLKALPYVIDWFERAEKAVDHDDESVVSSDDSSDYSDSDDSSSSSEEEDDDYDYQVEKRKLAAIYQFALAMPVLFIPTFNKKRKLVS